jgi:4-hydroxy-tetrahydrodipicolinate reductase
MRLAGAVSTDETRFSHQGETLTISITNYDRRTYSDGVVFAIKAIGSRPGLTRGLEPLLNLGAT